MATPDTSPPDPARLRRLIAAYEQRRAAGRAVDEDDIVRSYPDLAEGFRNYLARRSKAKRWSQSAAKVDPSSDHVAKNNGEPGTSSVDLPPSGDASARGWKRADLLPAGTIVDRYRITEVLGTGSMGIVYRAIDERLGRSVALKIPDLRGHERDSFLKRFESEARVAAGLAHPSLCPILDFGTHDDQPFLTMPVLPGPSLAHIVEIEGAQSPADVVQWLVPIAEGLREMHEHGITHRDLKPSNVLLDRRGRPVITDFGLARRNELSSDVRLTNASALLGSPAYCSPEQVRGDADVGPSSDLYSLGVLMYELLTGRLPHEGSIGEVLGAVLHVSPPPPSSLRPSLPKPLENLCLSLLHKHPAGRPQSAAAVLARLSDTELLNGSPRGERWWTAMTRLWNAYRIPILSMATACLAILSLATFLHDDSTNTEIVALQSPGSPPDPHIDAATDRDNAQDSPRTSPAAPDDDAGLDTETAPPSETPQSETPPVEAPLPAEETRSVRAPTATQPAEPTSDNRSRPTDTDAHHGGGLSTQLLGKLLGEAGSWITAAKPHRPTTWLLDPPSPRWQITEQAISLLDPAHLPIEKQQAFDVAASLRNGETLWFPQPLSDFDFEFDLTLPVDFRGELWFRSLATTTGLPGEAIIVPLELPANAPDNPGSVSPSWHVAGTLRGNRVTVTVNQQAYFESPVDDANLANANWHSVSRASADPGFFGIHVDSSAMQLSSARVEARPDPTRHQTKLKPPRLVSQANSPLSGAITCLGPDDWLQLAENLLPVVPTAPIARRGSLSNAAFDKNWNAPHLPKGLRANPLAANLPLLGGTLGRTGRRIAVWGSDYFLTASATGQPEPFEFVQLAEWNNIARVFPLDDGLFLSYQIGNRRKKDTITLWLLNLAGPPRYVASLTVSGPLETLAATPDGTQLIYTAGGRLFEYRLRGEYSLFRTQRVTWNANWLALSPNGQRLATVIGRDTIWTSQLAILEQRADQWRLGNRFALSALFWLPKDTPSPTDRQFAKFKIDCHRLQWSDDGQHLLGTFSKTERGAPAPTTGSGFVWHRQGSQPLLRMPKVSLSRVTFEQDSARVLFVHEDGVARLWELPGDGRQ